MKLVTEASVTRGLSGPASGFLIGIGDRELPTQDRLIVTQKVSLLRVHRGTLAHGIVIALGLRSERDDTRAAQVQTEDAPRTIDVHDESRL